MYAMPYVSPPTQKKNYIKGGKKGRRGERRKGTEEIPRLMKACAVPSVWTSVQIPEPT